MTPPTSNPMPRSRHARRVNPARLDRDPVLVRGKTKSGNGAWLMGAAALAFGAYVFNMGGVQTALGAFFSGLDRTAHRHEGQIVDGYLHVVPVLGLLLVGAIGWMLVARSPLLRRRGKRRASAPGGQCTIHEFAELCRAGGVGAKVARESYRMLLPEQKDRMRTVLDAELEAELGLGPEAVPAFYAELLRRADRPPARSMAIPFSTVKDLLQTVELYEDLSMAEGRMTGRVADLRREMAARRVDR